MLVFLTVVLTLITPLAAQGPHQRGTRGTRVLIEQALDEPARITLENVALGDAIQAVTDQTGVRIVMPPAVMRLAPQGERTLITKVDIANLPLREGLNRLFAPLAMTYVVLDNRIEVVPTPVLRTLGRTATWAELDTLAWLTALRPGEDPQALGALQKRLQMQVGSPNAGDQLAESIRNVGAGAGDDVLSAATNALGWGWSLSDNSIVIATQERLTRNRLQRPIFVRLNNTTLFEVMQAVGSAVGVRVQVEPGALAALPAQVQKNFSINAQNAPAEQALDDISANTGLGYMIGPDGVVFYKPENLPASASQAPAPGADPYVAKISISLGEGKTIDWLIRRSELPADLLEMRDDDIAEGFENLRRIRRTAAPDALESETAQRP